MAVDRVAGDVDLLEREAELELLGELVSRTRAGKGGLVLVEAHAGVGKTQLLRAAGELGEAEGLRVLRARGSELDRTFAFGLVRQLLEREVARDPELMTGGAEPALAVFGPPRGEVNAEESQFASMHGLQWLVVNLAAHGPLLLLVDDLHWADTASLRWLVFLAERVEDVQALIVAAARPAEPGVDQELLDALTMVPTASLLKPAPLTKGATAEVVRRWLPEAVDPFIEACHRATAGNPFMLGEQLRELAAEGVAGRADEVARVAEFGSEGVARAIRRRLRQLPPDATALVRALAVLGPGAPLDEAAALAGLDASAAADAADALARIDVLDAGRALDFVHPVVRSAVHDEIPPIEAQGLHAQAAELLISRRAESERVARHLLRLPASGDGSRVAVLRAASRAAASRGAHDAAAHYLRRALDEPPAPDERATVLHELGFAEASDRQPDGAEGHLREAMAVAGDPEQRARIALDLGFALTSNGEFPAAFEVFEGALADLDDRHEEIRAALEAEMVTLALQSFSLADKVSPLLERRFAQLHAGERLAPATLSCLAFASSRSRPPAADAIRIAERVLESTRLDEMAATLGAALAIALHSAGAHAREARVLDELMGIATRRGSRQTILWLLVLRSGASLRLGEVRRAEAEIRSALELGADDTGGTGRAWTAAQLIDALVARGALEDADEVAERHAEGPGAPATIGLALLLTARARLHLAQERPGAALSDARAAGDLVSPTIPNPWCCGWRSVAALALNALDRKQEARAIAESELADARRFAIPDAVGASLRTLGLVTGGAAGIAALRESLRLLEGGDCRLEHARSLLELGAALRRAGERVEARSVLREALDATARIGATGLADRAHEELVAAGARPRRDRRLLSGRESLTAGEDRVAALAAEGLTNREIAQRQFVTVKAVQWHLSNVYRKLDISSREELPEALGLPPQDVTLGQVG